MNSESMMKKFISDINAVSTRCLRIFAYFLILFYLYFVFAIHMEPGRTAVFIGISLITALVPTVLLFIVRRTPDNVMRNVIMICSAAIMTLMLVDFQQYAYSLILFPLVISALYFDRTFVLFTGMLSALGVLISEICRSNISDMLIYSTVRGNADPYLTIAVPNIMIIIVIALIVFQIVDINSKYIQQTIQNSITMVENEKGLIYALSEISENKSKLTGQHIRRVGEYMRVLAIASGFDEEYADKLATAAMAHDIGKLMISEEILDSPNKLTDEEYAIMKSHVLYGEAILEKCPGEILHLAKIMAKEHHEKWDGSGYLGMKGEEIAYISRMITVCDVFDALTATRLYKKGWPIEEAYDEIVRCSGKDFDPEIVKLFCDNFDKIREIHDSMPDEQIY